MNAKDIRDAKLDRSAWLNHKPARGWQLPNAAVVAIRNNPASPLATQFIAAINRMN